LSNDTQESGLQHHLDTGITFAKKGAALYLLMASLVVASVTLSSAFSGTQMPQDAVAQIGGQLFFLLLGVVGWFLIVGIAIDVFLFKIAPRLGVGV